MKKLFSKIAMGVVALTLVALTPLMLTGCGRNNDYDFTVGILSGAQIPAFAEGRPGFENRLRELMAEQNKTVQFIYQNANGNNVTAGTIATDFAVRGVDLIFSMGTGATNSAIPVANANDVPLVFGIITDPVGQGMVTAGATGSSSALPFETQTELLEQLTGEVLSATNRVAFISTSEPNSVATRNRLINYSSGGAGSVEIIEISNMNQLQAEFIRISNDSTISVIYIPQDNYVTGNMPMVADLNRTFTQLPIVVADLPIVKYGATMSLSVCFEQNGARAAEIAFEILFNGTSPVNIPFYAPSADTLSLYINLGEAKAIGFEIPQVILDRPFTEIGTDLGDGSSFPWTWVGIGIGSAVLLGAVAFGIVFFVKRRKNNEVI